MSSKREGSKGGGFWSIFARGKTQSHSSSPQNQSGLGAAGPDYAELNRKKKISDRQKQHEILNRDHEQFNPKKTHQEASILLDETTKKQFQKLNPINSTRDTMGTIKRQPVNQELRVKNHKPDVNVPWCQILKSNQTSRYNQQNRTNNYNQQQNSWSQNYLSPSNTSYPTEQENSLPRNTQTPLKGSEAPPTNQERNLKAETKKSTSEDERKGNFSRDQKKVMKTQGNDYLSKTGQKSYDTFAAVQFKKESNTGTSQEKGELEFNTQYNEKRNDGKAPEKFSRSSENYQFETGQSKFYPLHIPNNREILEKRSAPTVHMKTVAEIEAAVQNLGGTNNPGNLQSSEMDHTAYGSKVFPEMLLSRADRQLETNLGGHSAYFFSKYGTAVTGKERVPDKTLTQNYFEDEPNYRFQNNGNFQNPNVSPVTNTYQRVDPSIDVGREISDGEAMREKEHTDQTYFENERNVRIQNNGNFQRQKSSQKALTYQQVDSSIEAGTEISEDGTMYEKENAGQTYVEDERNVHVQNNGNFQRQKSSQKALTYQQADSSIEAGTEISEDGTMYKGERAGHAKDTTEDDSLVFKKIESIESNLKTLYTHIKRFDGRSSYYYFIEENLTRLLLKLDKLPVEHDQELKLKRRNAIKYTYELQNKLEHRNSKFQAKRQLTASQI